MKENKLLVFEERIPKGLIGTYKKIDGYMKSLAEDLRNAKETLVEKATTGKGKYVTNLFPVAGECLFLDKVIGNKASKKLKIISGAAFTGIRTVGIVALAMREPFLSSSYIAPTILQGVYIRECGRD